MFRRRTKRRLTRANETPNEDKNNRSNKEMYCVSRRNPKNKEYPNAADFAPSEQHASPLATTTVASCLSRDAEEGRKRATNEEIRDIIDDGIFHEFNKGYKHKGGEYRVCEHEGTSSVFLRRGMGNHNTNRRTNPVPDISKWICIHHSHASRIERNQPSSTPCHHSKCGEKMQIIMERLERKPSHSRERYLIWCQQIHHQNTEESESSFVETFHPLPVPNFPRLFAGHTWGEPFFHNMVCNR